MKLFLPATHCQEFRVGQKHSMFYSNQATTREGRGGEGGREGGREGSREGGREGGREGRRDTIKDGVR